MEGMRETRDATADGTAATERSVATEETIDAELVRRRIEHFVKNAQR